jgi:hypothetical protein
MVPLVPCAGRIPSTVSNQIDPGSLGFSGLGIGANFERYGRPHGDVVALTQRRNVEENIIAAAVRPDEAKAAILIEHFHFAF